MKSSKEVRFFQKLMSAIKEAFSAFVHSVKSLFGFVVSDNSGVNEEVGRDRSPVTATNPEDSVHRLSADSSRDPEIKNDVSTTAANFSLTPHTQRPKDTGAAGEPVVDQYPDEDVHNETRRESLQHEPFIEIDPTGLSQVELERLNKLNEIAHDLDMTLLWKLKKPDSQKELESLINQVKEGFARLEPRLGFSKEYIAASIRVHSKLREHQLTVESDNKTRVRK